MFKKNEEANKWLAVWDILKCRVQIVTKFDSKNALLVEYLPTGAVVALDDEKDLRPWI